MGAGSEAKASADRIIKTTPATIASGKARSRNLWVKMEKG